MRHGSRAARPAGRRRAGASRAQDSSRCSGMTRTSARTGMKFVSRPARDGVGVQVLGDPGPGGLAEVKPDVHPLGARRAPQARRRVAHEPMVASYSSAGSSRGPRCAAAAPRAGAPPRTGSGSGRRARAAARRARASRGTRAGGADAKSQKMHGPLLSGRGCTPSARAPRAASDIGRLALLVDLLARRRPRRPSSRPSRSLPRAWRRASA